MSPQGEINKSPILNCESSDESIYKDDLFSSGYSNRPVALNTTVDQQAEELKEQKENRLEEFKTTEL